MARKTLSVETLRSEVNRRNRESTCSPEVRQGWNSILESMLMATGNYRGFRFLTPDKVPDGKAPGIKENQGDFPLAIGNDNADRFKGTDDTRRAYL